jgi:hypothetical protein
MGKVDMKKPERSLLIYCETCAVDHIGKMDPRHLNAADFEILDRWEKEGFIRYGRIEAAEFQGRSRGARTHWCRLSEDAWQEAHWQRRLRAEGSWEDREWRTTSEMGGGEHIA